MVIEHNSLSILHYLQETKLGVCQLRVLTTEAVDGEWWKWE